MVLCETSLLELDPREKNFDTRKKIPDPQEKRFSQQKKIMRKRI